MSKNEVVLAYRDSVFDEATYDLERRVESRKTPLVGGVWPALKKIGNRMWRPFKVGGAFVLGYKSDSNREFPEVPPVPEVFQDSSLGNAFGESWKLKKEAAKARVESLAKLLDVDISGWWQNASIASYAEAKDNRVIFPEDGVAHDAWIYGRHSNSLPISLSSGRGGSGVTKT